MDELLRCIPMNKVRNQYIGVVVKVWAGGDVTS